MCKAKSCKYWKTCFARRQCMDFRCADYEKAPEKTKNTKNK